MSTHTRARTRRQIRHTASRSESHRRDKHDGERRRDTAWIGVEAPERPSPRRSFGALVGHEYIHDGQTWRRCEDPEEYADYLERETERRGWYRAETTRKGVAVTMKRRVAAAVEVLTTTFAPWLSDAVAAIVRDGRDPRPQLAEVRNRWLDTVERLLEGKRHVLGYSFHGDTDDLHFDLALTRQDGEGGRIGEPALRLVGPWCVGVDRQLRAKAQINEDKRRQLRRSAANFRHRYGEGEVPLDIALARALDEAAEAVLGPELEPYREAYARRVPELERQHAAAQLAAIEAARTKLLERTELEPPERPCKPLPPEQERQREPDFPSLS